MKPDAPRVLVADDQPDVLESLRLLLKPEGFGVETVASPAAVLAAASSRELRRRADRPQLHPRHHLGRGGARPARPAQALDGTLPVVVMTAWGSVEVAVEAMRRGARDFVQKPWENDRLLAILRTQVELAARAAARPAPGGREPAAARRGAAPS